MPHPTQPSHEEAAASSGGASPVEDEQLYCPVCHYNLTGLTEDRCPECGSAFDRQRLREAQVLSLRPLIPWEKRDELGWVRAFWQTVRISCGRPRQFCFAFSIRPQKTRALSFYILCLVIMAAGLAGVIGAHWAYRAYVLHSPPHLRWVTEPEWQEAAYPVLLMPGVCPLVTVVLCELTLPWIYAALMPQADGRRRVAPWRSIVRYSAAHLVLFALLPVFFMGLVLIDRLAGIDLLGDDATGVMAGGMVEMVMNLSVMLYGLVVTLLWGMTMKAVFAWRAQGRRVGLIPRLLTPWFGLLVYGVTLIVTAWLIH